MISIAASKLLCASLVSSLAIGLMLAGEDDGHIEFVVYGLELDPIEVSHAEALPGSKLKEIGLLCEWDANSIKAASVLFGVVEAKGVERKARIASVPFQLDGKSMHALMALTAKGGFLRAAVVDEFGEPQKEWRQTLDNFQHYDVPKLKGAKPRSYLAMIREQLNQKRDDEESALTLGLLDAVRFMQDQAAVFNLPKTGRTLGPAEITEMQSTSYAKLAALVDPLEPLLGATSDEFVRIAMSSSAAASSMAQGVRDGDQARVNAGRRQILGNCNACHRMEMPNGVGSMKQVFAKARLARGIGDGYYQVGHDLRISHNDRERMQRVADAMRCAALLIDADSQR